MRCCEKKVRAEIKQLFAAQKSQLFMSPTTKQKPWRFLQKSGTILNKEFDVQQLDPPHRIYNNRRINLLLVLLAAPDEFARHFAANPQSWVVSEYRCRKIQLRRRNCAGVFVQKNVLIAQPEDEPNNSGTSVFSRKRECWFNWRPRWSFADEAVTIQALLPPDQRGRGCNVDTSSPICHWFDVRDG